MNKNAESQVLRLQQKMSSLEENLRRNGEEMDRLKKQLRESERQRKELKEIEKENEIIDEKEEAREEVKKHVNKQVDEEGNGEEDKLCFDASIPPLSMQTYNVLSESSTDEDKATVGGTARVESNEFKTASSSGNIVLKNDKITPEFDATTGMLESVIPVGSSSATKTHMKFVKYGARGHKRIL